MNKNWNDRADKDLFFTILSVKAIGVISGAEWTTIGNHMRSQGYGFTNEGCRQHFQGLRRAQNKAEANETLTESARRSDPTLNPITRRPGPGRGRPKKLMPSLIDVPATPGVIPNMTPSSAVPGVPEAAASAILNPVPSNVLSSMPGQKPDQMSGVMGAIPSGISNGSNQPQNAQQASVDLHQPPLSSQTEMPASGTEGMPALTPNTIPSENTSSSEPDGTTIGDQLHSDQEHVSEHDLDEHPAKRPRLDTQEELSADLALDDEAVLALAAHHGPESAYPTEFNYSET